MRYELSRHFDCEDRNGGSWRWGIVEVAPSGRRGNTIGHTRLRHVGEHIVKELNAASEKGI